MSDQCGDASALAGSDHHQCDEYMIKLFAVKASHHTANTPSSDGPSCAMQDQFDVYYSSKSTDMDQIVTKWSGPLQRQEGGGGDAVTQNDAAPPPINMFLYLTQYPVRELEIKSSLDMEDLTADERAAQARAMGRAIQAAAAAAAAAPVEEDAQDSSCLQKLSLHGVDLVFFFKYNDNVLGLQSLQEFKLENIPEIHTFDHRDVQLALRRTEKPRVCRFVLRDCSRRLLSILLNGMNYQIHMGEIVLDNGMTKLNCEFTFPGTVGGILSELFRQHAAGIKCLDLQGTDLEELGNEIWEAFQSSPCLTTIILGQITPIPRMWTKAYESLTGVSKLDIFWVVSNRNLTSLTFQSGSKKEVLILNRGTNETDQGNLLTLIKEFLESTPEARHHFNFSSYAMNELHADLLLRNRGIVSLSIALSTTTLPCLSHVLASPECGLLSIEIRSIFVVEDSLLRLHKAFEENTSLVNCFVCFYGREKLLKIVPAIHIALVRNRIKMLTAPTCDKAGFKREESTCLAWVPHLMLRPAIRHGEDMYDQDALFSPRRFTESLTRKFMVVKYFACLMQTLPSKKRKSRSTS